LFILFSFGCNRIDIFGIDWWSERVHLFFGRTSLCSSVVGRSTTHSWLTPLSLIVFS
jgi:hypothetical protein